MPDRVSSREEIEERLRAGQHDALNFPRAQLAGVDLGHLELTKANFAGADLSGSNLAHTDLSEANLSGADLEGAVMFGANLTGAELLGANLRAANLSSCEAPRAGFGGVHLDEASLFEANLREASFSRSSLRGADLRCANLRGARFHHADLREADASHADLGEAELDDSNVEGTTFDGSDLRGARLPRLVRFERASWIEVDVRETDFRNAYALRRLIIDENYLHEFRIRGGRFEVLYQLWRVTSDCGRSFWRWAAWTGAVILLFAAAFYGVDIDYGEHPTVLSPLYYSVVTLTTLGYGDVLPASIAAQVVAMLEVCVGYVALGGLISILGNKMARRGE
jgi:uncharacterized protein YjbI with pentapeptide repeats